MLLAAAAGNAVSIFDVEGGNLREGRKISSASETTATCAVWNHNNRILASAFANGLLSINTLTAREPSLCNLQEGSSPDKRINAVQFSAGSRYLISGGADRVVRFWDLKHQQLKHVFPECSSSIQTLAFTGQSDEHVVAGSEAGVVYLYTQNGMQSNVLQVDGETSPVQFLQSSPHPFVRDKVGAVYGSGSLRVWDAATASVISSFEHLHWAPATSLAFSPVSKNLVATAGLDKRIVFCDIAQKKEMNCLEGPYPITSISLYSNGHSLATGTSTGHILLYDMRRTAKPLSVHVIDAQKPESVNFLQFGSSLDKVRSMDDPYSRPKMKKHHSFSMQGMQSSLQHLATPKELSTSSSLPSSPLVPPVLSDARPTTNQSHDHAPSTKLDTSTQQWLQRELETMKQALSDEIANVHLEVLRQHQAQQTEMTKALQDVTKQLQAIIAENKRLHDENDRLRNVF
ncbi:hypothetical protein SDRG_15156 [Saprolegnia diclina VS20]|uniref:Uncharacterized protein n=1 Tax=Saprolegnia diclina (strain VS20) TaxID=1156394 RepID=T0RBW4_SAPDV|nr:hypothetical protein SDRG_15156 [Saprolegnia diclina VS20]EQC27042.1 hypothetical protein SDRG_15156 [Saprolegnia diclina VS20]|eukprot:XP_008619542.1 hypothetical protein SDRG_15156 [Saprolegnia diclina VS20]